MKPQYLYLFLAVLIVVILAGSWVGSRNVEVVSELQESVPEQQQSLLPGFTQPIPNASAKTPAITIIKRPSLKKNTVPLVEETESIPKARKRPSLEPKQTPPDYGGGGPGGGGGSGSGSGDTRDRKRPTEVESNELNAKGIILY